MLESAILGTIQGIAEWLPVSSEGVLVLVQVGLFKSQLSAGELIRTALFLHFGTFLAALIYFRKDVLSLLKAFFNIKNADTETRKVLQFLILGTLASAFIGYGLLTFIEGIEESFELGSKVIIGAIALLLFVTAWLQLKGKSQGIKKARDLKLGDGLLLGAVQGFAVLPGISRSGSTVGTLLIRKYDDATSLRLSFLMSLPAVLGGNILLNADKFTFDTAMFVALGFAFVFGLATIHALLKMAQKINFGYFVLLFAVLTLLAVFI